MFYVFHQAQEFDTNIKKSLCVNFSWPNYFIFWHSFLFHFSFYNSCNGMSHPPYRICGLTVSVDIYSVHRIYLRLASRITSLLANSLSFSSVFSFTINLPFFHLRPCCCSFHSSTTFVCLLPL